MGDFLSGLGTLLGGGYARRRIDEDGFDFREQDAIEEWERQRKQQLAQQADENRALGQAADYMTYAQDPSEDDISALLPQIDDERRLSALRGVVGGKALQNKYNLKAMDILGRRDLEERRQRGRETLVGLRGDEQQELENLRHKNRAIMTPEEERRLDILERMAGAAETRANRPVGGLGGGLGVPRYTYDTKEKREVLITPDIQAQMMAEPSRFVSNVTGRNLAGEESSGAAFNTLIQNADAALSRYENSSIWSPREKVAAWSQYQSVIGSLGQMVGRGILMDQRVSQQDREVYANTIGLTSFILAELAPDEARKRFELLLDLKADAEAGVPYAASSAARRAESVLKQERGETEQTRVGPDGRTYRKVEGGWEAQ